MDTTGGMKIWIALTIAVVVAFTIILLTAILERKPYNSQHTRLPQKHMTLSLRQQPRLFTSSRILASG